MKMSLMYVDRWSLREDGGLDVFFRDGSGVKLTTSSVVSVDDMTVVMTNSGCAYVIGEPLYRDEWPANIPASAINEALYSAIRQFQSNVRGDKLWELFQDELSTVFADR